MKLGHKLRDLVRERDVVCQNCGSSGSAKNPLTVHHIKPRCQFPELSGNLDNLILWCRNCHRQYHKENPIKRTKRNKRRRKCRRRR